ncbi:PsbP-related protein [Aerosakkonema sp. BLCC-F183]|uniref:PsbP-related protein n=1 Tax=Aerosakkonema sp. BLCC-F183 TaxID=3342834 RepID=UPI0035BADD12
MTSIPPSQSPKSSRKKKKLSLRKSITLVGVILGIPGSIAALLSIPECKEILFPSMKEYSDKDYGFQLKYPKDWQPIKKDPTLTGVVAEFTPPKDKSSTSCQASIIVGYSEPQRIMSLDQYTNSVIIPEIKTDFPNIQLPFPTAENLAQRNANQVIYSGQLDGCNWQKLEIWTLDKIKAYRITYQAEISDYPKFEKTAKEMIKTFELR